MPRVEIDNTPKPTWHDLQDLIMMSLFNSTPSEEEQLRQEIKDLIEEAKKNVCETDKRDND